HPCFYVFVSFTHPTPTEPSTLSLHDALPISHRFFQRILYAGGILHLLPAGEGGAFVFNRKFIARHSFDHSSPRGMATIFHCAFRSEEHTSELQSRENLVCRLLLEKKNTHKNK